MASRNCPNCNRPLSSYDYYFCSNCGSQLNVSTIKTQVPFKVKEFDPFAYKIPKELKTGINITRQLHLFYVYNKKLTVDVALIFGLLVFAYALYIFYVVPLVNQLNTPLKPNSPQVQLHELESDLDLSVGRFNSSYVSFVPSTALVYLEINDLSKAIPLFTKASHFQAEFLKNAPSLFENDAVIFGKGSVDEGKWAILVKPKVVYPIEVLIKNFSDEYWNFEVFEDVLIISNDLSLNSEIKLVKQGASKSIVQSLAFSTSREVLPKDGKIKVIFTSAEGKDLLNSLLDKDIKVVTNGLINRTLNSGYNSLVIK